MRPVIFTGAKVIDVVSRKVVNTDVLVKDAKTYLGEAPLIQGCEVIDLKGAYLAPGFIDGHIHIESSMLTPIEFSREAVKKGTTAVFCDPHEIANVLGPRGVELFLEQAEQAVIKINIAVPSCVPATDMETSGGAITLDDIKKFLKDERVYGLAEMMNFPGIVHGVGDARQKVKAALDAGKLVDGHAPGLSGKPLEDYISNGEDDWEVRISSDHECTSAQEAIEKWEKGMFIMLRHGSASKDLENILPGICEKGISLENFGLVSDDLSAEDMRKKGHVDGLVRAAAQIFENVLGCGRERAVIEAITMVTLNIAAHFRKNTGYIGKGAAADLVVFDSLKDINPKLVMVNGRIVYRDGMIEEEERTFDYSGYSHPVNIREGYAEKMMITCPAADRKARVIGAQYDSLLTEAFEVSLPCVGGVLRADPARGIFKIAVLERHKGTGNVRTGFIKGISFRGGAIASTVAHDSHNLIVLGADETSMIKAVEKVRSVGGGMVAVHGEKSEALPLDLAGLMSTLSADEVIRAHKSLLALTSEMGFDRDPFLTLSFMALPVIPHLKITDKGLVDVDKFAFTELFI